MAGNRKIEKWAGVFRAGSGRGSGWSGYEVPGDPSWIGLCIAAL